MSDVRRAWRSFWALTWPERRGLILSMGLLPPIALGLRLFGYQRMHSVLARVAGWRRLRRSEFTRAQAIRLAEIMDIAARRGPVHVSCLACSLGMWVVLQRRGLASDLRIGARKSPEGLEFHAWLEHEGVVINDSESVGSDYTPFDDKVIPRRARFD